LTSLSISETNLGLTGLVIDLGRLRECFSWPILTSFHLWIELSVNASQLFQLRFTRGDFGLSSPAPKKPALQLPASPVRVQAHACMRHAIPVWIRFSLSRLEPILDPWAFVYSFLSVCFLLSTCRPFTWNELC